MTSDQRRSRSSRGHRDGPIDLGDLQSAGVFTDGVSRLVTHHGGSWAELMHLLEADSGPRKVIEAVRDADINDPAAIERGKRHDDATAVLCRFPSSAYGSAEVARRIRQDFLA